MTTRNTRAISRRPFRLLLGLGCIAAFGSVEALADPAVDDCPRKRVCVEVVVDDAGCPAYTRYAGVRDKLPEISKATANRIVWYLVDEAGNEQEKRFKIYFDPFKKPEIDGVGHDESQRLDPNVPVEVDFKYTVVSENCTPLDPRIRVLN